jgi:prepilin-type N-terminal cleavage/methylation domain-containing protein
MARKLKNQKGITLIEVIASMLIFSIGILLLIPMVITSIKGNEFAEQTTMSAHYLQEKIEELKNTVNPVSGEDTVSSKGMSRTWTVEDFASNLKKFTVVITWTDRDSVSHTNTTVTYHSSG